MFKKYFFLLLVIPALIFVFAPQRADASFASVNIKFVHRTTSGALYSRFPGVKVNARSTKSNDYKWTSSSGTCYGCRSCSVVGGSGGGCSNSDYGYSATFSSPESGWVNFTNKFACGQSTCQAASGDDGNCNPFLFTINAPTGMPYGRWMTGNDAVGGSNVTSNGTTSFTTNVTVANGSTQHLYYKYQDEPNFNSDYHTLTNDTESDKKSAVSGSNFTFTAKANHRDQHPTHDVTHYANLYVEWWKDEGSGYVQVAAKSQISAATQWTSTYTSVFTATTAKEVKIKARIFECHGSGACEYYNGWAPGFEISSDIPSQASSQVDSTRLYVDDVAYVSVTPSTPRTCLLSVNGQTLSPGDTYTTTTNGPVTVGYWLSGNCPTGGGLPCSRWQTFGGYYDVVNNYWYDSPYNSTWDGNQGQGNAVGGFVYAQAPQYWNRYVYQMHLVEVTCDQSGECKANGEGWECADVAIDHPEPPDVSCSVSPTSGDLPLTVTAIPLNFKAGSAVSWVWEPGVNGSSTGSLSHTYKTSGTKTITVSGVDQDNRAASTTCPFVNVGAPSTGSQKEVAP